MPIPAGAEIISLDSDSEPECVATQSLPKRRAVAPTKWVEVEDHDHRPSPSVGRRLPACLALPAPRALPAPAPSRHWSAQHLEAKPSISPLPAPPSSAPLWQSAKQPDTKLALRQPDTKLGLSPARQDLVGSIAVFMLAMDHAAVLPDQSILYFLQNRRWQVPEGAVVSEFIGTHLMTMVVADAASGGRVLGYVIDSPPRPLSSLLTLYSDCVIRVNLRSPPPLNYRLMSPKTHFAVTVLVYMPWERRHLVYATVREALLFLPAQIPDYNHWKQQNPSVASSRLHSFLHPSTSSDAEIADEVSKLFESHSDTVGSTPIDPPPCISVSLLPYQKTGLGWLIEKERCDTLPPFFSQREDGEYGGRVYYYNGLSKEAVPDRPSALRGGILADEMGLGKTLQMLCLLLHQREHILDTLKKENMMCETKPASAVCLQVSRGSSTRMVESFATLVVCPFSVISRWEDEVTRHVTEGEVRVLRWHGCERSRSAMEIAAHDLVLTTYGTLTAELETRYEAGDVLHRLKAPLGKIQWLRVILDEGHCINNSSTKMHKAVLLLTATNRWVLTGTPVQNRLSDIQAMFSFLRLQPFCDNILAWNTFVARPIKRDPKNFVILHTIVRNIALRRTKNCRDPVTGSVLCPLPDKRLSVCSVAMGPEERFLYDRLEDKSLEEFLKMVKANIALCNYAHILVLILKLRMACLAPVLLSGSDGHSIDENDVLVQDCAQMLSEAAESDMVCVSCQTTLRMERLKDSMFGSCAHRLCIACFEKLESSPSVSGELVSDELVSDTCSRLCQACNVDVTWIKSTEKRFLKDPIVDSVLSDSACLPDSQLLDPKVIRKLLSGEAVGSKVRCVMEALDENRERDPLEKCVIFSSFVCVLRELEPLLVSAGYTFERLDGGVSLKHREELLKRFKLSHPASPTVLLCSLKAGGVGIDIKEANVVFILDPWWNRAAEDQAIDRVHRVGQRRDVRVTRFICEDTIEERMRELQEQKHNLMKGAFQKMSPEELRDMRLDTVKTLLSGGRRRRKAAAV